jgi:hypothetical protein
VSVDEDGRGSGLSEFADQALRFRRWLVAVLGPVLVISELMQGHLAVGLGLALGCVVLWADLVPGLPGTTRVGNYLNRSPRLVGAFWIVSAALFLAWEWLRDRGPGPWLPGHAHILAIICAPLLILLGLATLRQRPSQGDLSVSVGRPYVLVGLVLGAINAYVLGVWRDVSGEEVRKLSYAPGLLIIAGFVAAVLLISRLRARR